VYKKALYIESTDATFTVKKPQPTWQGDLGPTLRAEVTFNDIYFNLLFARDLPLSQLTYSSMCNFHQQQVGDTMKVVFKNKATHPFTMHPHGVKYDKNNEGALYMFAQTPGDDVPLVDPLSTQ
jgi:manganese oxidase